MPKTLHRIKFGYGQNLCNTWQTVQSTGCRKHPLPRLFLVKWMRDKRLGTPKYVCGAGEASSPGGDPIYPWVGRCGAAPHTLTLFKTNIADFPTLFKTEFRFLIPCLRHLINIRACKNFAVYRPRKDILFKAKIDKSIPWLRQKMINSKNPEQHTLAGRTSPLSPYKGVSPPPPPG